MNDSVIPTVSSKPRLTTISSVPVPSATPVVLEDQVRRSLFDSPVKTNELDLYYSLIDFSPAVSCNSDYIFCDVRNMEPLYSMEDGGSIGHDGQPTYIELIEEDQDLSYSESLGHAPAQLYNEPSEPTTSGIEQHQPIYSETIPLYDENTYQVETEIQDDTNQLNGYIVDILGTPPKLPSTLPPNLPTTPPPRPPRVSRQDLHETPSTSLTTPAKPARPVPMPPIYQELQEMIYKPS